MCQVFTKGRVHFLLWQDEAKWWKREKWREAERRGWEHARETDALGDGAAWISGIKSKIISTRAIRSSIGIMGQFKSRFAGSGMRRSRAGAERLQPICETVPSLRYHLERSLLLATQVKCTQFHELIDPRYAICYN